MIGKTFDNWNDFYEYFRQLLEEPGLNGQVGFRGQACKRWSLKSSLIRELPKNCTFDEAIAFEKKLLNQYQQGAKNQNLPDIEIPDRRDCDHILQWFSRMQQYGAPTRLLDWTLNPYYATYFAIEDLESNTDVAVWILYYQKLHDAMQVPPKNEVSLPRVAKAFEGTYEKPSDLPGICPVFWRPGPEKPKRMEAQKGFYTQCDDPMRDQDEVMYKIAQKDGVKPFLHKVTILSKAKLEFLANLYKMDITNAKLFPGADGWGKSIQECGRLIKSGLVPASDQKNAHAD